MLAFAEGETRKTIQIQILDDDRPESDESFRLELDEEQVGLYLGEPSSIAVTIVSDEPDIDSVTFSVGGGGNLLANPVGIDVVDGVATFAQTLPESVDRGDRVDIEGLGAVFIGDCTSDTTCAVYGGKGYDARGVLGGTAISISRAFASLADAVFDAADSEHLDTLDLVDADLMLELLCYGGEADTEAVVIEGWITSPEAGITISAPTTGVLRGPGQRHDGRWNNQAYRLEVYDNDCIRSSVGNVAIEGLQLFCRGFVDGIAGIRLDGFAGDVEIGETLIRLDGTASNDQRTGVAVTAASPSEVVIRNSVLWDIGDGSSFEQTGILVDGADSTVFAANNTIVGAGHGIRNLGGSVTAINNLVLESRMDAFDGEFEPDSARNLSDDESAPGPPVNTGGPIVVRSPAPGTAADYRLGCGVLDLELGEDVVVTHNFNPWDWERLFDGIPETLAVTPQVEEGVVTLEFAEPRWITGTGIAFSNGDAHSWSVAGAMTEGDLGDPNSPSFVQLVPVDTEVNHRERSRSFVTFDSPQEMRFIRLTVKRATGVDYIHVGEWWIDGLNPACGQGADLKNAPEHAFAVDVEGRGRIGSWDIGADQSNELTVGFIGGPWMWWESEGEARVQVLLSEPASAPVSVRYSTSNGSAYEGLDFTGVQGSLTFAPGEFSKIVAVPLVDDGPGDRGEDFFLNLSDAAGARIGRDQWRFELNEGDEPLRVRLTDSLMEASEAEEIFTAGIEISSAHPVAIEGSGDVSDHSAYFSLDYRGMGDGAPWPYFLIPGGQTQGTFEFEIVADGIPEPDEGFLVHNGWFSGAEAGVPAIGYVRILDHSPLLVSFDSDSFQVDETDGTVSLRVVLSEAANEDVFVRFRTIADSAASGGDFVALDEALVFQAGQTEQFIDVQILNDDLVEGPEVLRVELYEPIGAAFGEFDAANVTIVDDDVPNQVSFEVDVVEEFEDIGTIRLDVVLTRAEDEPVSVSYRFLPESATPGVDFIGEDGELIFAPGEVRRTIEIEVIDDADPELEEFIFIELHDPVGVILGDLTAVWVAIYDNEPPAIFAFLDPDFMEVFEGDVSLPLVVFLSEEPATEVSVRYRTVPGSAEEGLDFVSADGQLIFGPGIQEQFFEIQVLEDIVLEDPESFSVELYDPNGVVLTQWWTTSVTILDNEPPSVLARFENETVEVDEGTGTAQLRLVLEAPTPRDATVRYRTVAMTATPGLDYVAVDDEVTIAAGQIEHIFDVGIVDDGFTEEPESFRVELYDPVDLDLGYPPFTTVEILDNEPEPVTVTYSVGVDSTNWIYEPIGIDIIDGNATFVEPWPPGMARGDRLEIEGAGAVFLGDCSGDRICEVFDEQGGIPADVSGGLAISATRAFFSLQDAVTGAADAEHLGTLDLVAARSSLEILCYGSWGEPDSTPVSVDGWITSPENQIRVVVPSLPPWPMYYPRHQGRWDETFYNLTVSTGTCVTSSVGNLVLEGLQLHCAGDPGTDVHGVLLDGVDGDVRISESIIRLDGASGPGDRIGVEMRSAVAGELVVRNSILYDLGDGSSENHVGIVNSSAAATLFAANNTISGGAFGIRSLGGESTAVNNLAVDATLACFDGPFAAGSTRNLASDATAPDPPAGEGGTVTMVDPTSGGSADFHLECGILGSVSEFYNEYSLSQIEQLELVFDGNPETLISSPGKNEARLVLVFSEPQTFTGTAVEFSNCENYTWTVEVAGSEENLTNKTGDYRVLVNEQDAVNFERVWDGVEFESPESCGAIALTARRNCDSNPVHLNEWMLSGHNAACGQAVDLSKDPNHAFGGDVDSAGRSTPWDIGADQGRDATVDFYYGGPSEWWESEGEAKIQVDLSRPVDGVVKVRWEAQNGAALAGEDFVGTRGELTIPPGSVSGIISIPLIDDGWGEEPEDFSVFLTHVSGAARLEYMPGFTVSIVEGDPPARVSLASQQFAATEEDGGAVVWVNLSQPLGWEATAQIDAWDDTAHIGPDFTDPFATAVFPAGTTQVPITFQLVDDDDAEPTERFIVKSRWLNGVTRGVPARGVVRIVDGDSAKRGDQASEISSGGDLRSAAAGAVSVRTVRDSSVDRRSLHLMFVDGAFYAIAPNRALAFQVDPARSRIVNRTTGRRMPLTPSTNGTFLIGEIPGGAGDDIELRLCREEDRERCETVILKEDRQ